jgi:hypothetical protein
MSRRALHTFVAVSLLALAGTAHAALLGLNKTPTPQPWVTAENLSVTYAYTTVAATPDMTVSGNGTSGGVISYKKNGVSGLFGTYGRYTLSLFTNDLGTVFSGNLTVRGNYTTTNPDDGGAPGSGINDEILFQSSSMVKFGWSENATQDSFEFIFLQQTSTAFAPITAGAQNYISVILNLGQIAAFTGVSSGSGKNVKGPFNISNFSTNLAGSTVYYPEPTFLSLSGFCVLLLKRTRRIRVTSRASLATRRGVR